MGPVALDAAYLVLPLPSCWCFAELRTGISTAVMSAYRSAMSAAGIPLGSTWNMTLAAALAILFVARRCSLEEAIGEDDTWGTTRRRDCANSPRRS